MTHLPNPETHPQFYAGVPFKRFIAWIIDTAIIVALCLVIGLLSVFVGFFFFALLLLAVGFAYRVVMLAYNSATLGMQFTAIEFRATDGNRFDLPLAFWHTLGYSASFAFPILQIVSVVLMLTTDRGQGLTDNLLGTVALARRAPV